PGVLPDGAADPSTPLPDGASPNDAGSNDDAGDVDSGTDASDGGGEPQNGPLWPGYVDYAINHVLSTGQSNSVSNGASPEGTKTPSFNNIMFDTGVMPMGSCNGDGCTVYQTPGSFVPLIEGDGFFPGGKVETASAGIASEISHIAKQRYEFGTRDGYPAGHDV